MIFTSILGAEFQEGKLVSALRNLELDSIDFDIRKERHYDLLGQVTELGFYLRYELAQDSRLVLLDVHLETEVERLDHSPAAYTKEVAESLRSVELKSEYIAGSIRG